MFMYEVNAVHAKRPRVVIMTVLLLDAAEAKMRIIKVRYTIRRKYKNEIVRSEWRGTLDAQCLIFDLVVIRAHANFVREVAINR